MQLLLPSFHPSCTFPWQNLDELSSLWAVFTKCKRHLRDGFRLENMMWRLWYRQAIMQKRSEPRAPSLSIPSSSPVRLSRTRSLPDLSRQLHQTQPQRQGQQQQQQQQQSLMLQQPQPAAMPKRKFFINDEDEEDDVSDSESSLATDNSYWPTNESASTSCSSLPLGDEELFVKQCPSPRTTSPVSTLSTLLQQRSPRISTGLKRCQSHFSRLDEWFTNTENPIHQ